VIERRFGRRDELLEQAAEASREGLRTRGERITSSARPILHTSIAAAGAWLVATELLGHAQPFFAPISAVVTLGLTVGQRRRRAIELAIGVAVGIAIADGLVRLLGTGTWQIAVIVGLAMIGATLVGGGPLLASQAGASAVLVATRFVDALTGGTVALLVSSLILPVNPLRLVEASMGPLLGRLRRALELLARALESREPAAADEALVAVARVDVAHEGLLDALKAAGEVAQLSPRRRRALSRLERYAVAAGELGLAIENVRALARGAVRAINLEDAVPGAAIEAVRELAVAVERLERYLDEGDPEPARAAAIHAAALANGVLEATGNLSAVHIVGQIRLAAVDLMRATGLERERAQEAVRSAR
jgi:uncharacterized membrane protein YgaE (UPF0421/DUF939 family)